VKAKKFLLPVLLMTAGGCASGGGDSRGPSSSNEAYPPPARTETEPSPCGTMNGRPVQCVPNQRTIIDDAMAEAEKSLRQMPVALFKALYGYEPYWAKSALPLSGARPAPETSYVRMDLSYEPNASATIGRIEFLPDDFSVPMGSMAPALGDPKAVNPFTKRPGNTGVDSTGLGFEYQSFGVWNDHLAVRAGITAWSHGQTTPASAVPSSGNARFTGQVVGLYVSPAGAGSTARADLSVDANFSTRSLGFASTNSVAAGASNPHLNLRGTLTYAPGQNSFAGTLSNASGTLTGTSKGQFYGPKAEELGGALRVRAASGPETFAGAYGAKR
jgi:hypothetical protein